MVVSLEGQNKEFLLKRKIRVLSMISFFKSHNHRILRK